MDNESDSGGEGTVTHLLGLVRAEQPGALGQLFDHVYEDLRRLAADRIRRSSSRSLNGTALVHDAFIRLTNRDALGARDRGHFFAIFARAMRDALVDSIRHDCAQRRGGDATRVELIDFEADGLPLRIDVLAIQEALDELRQADAQAADMIDLRVFGGRSLEESAGLLGLTRSEADRNWKYGRAWLARRLEGGN
ncbi:MAG: RNA polymerase subunit sigma [Phycisphaerae bacterium]|jgi:RNA polymerase sigma factor (TIGR02999 family)|nr:RNA polymerase subunit sigma [Phycisphaerae bacterium]